MRPITVADAKLILQRADTFKEMGVPVEAAARKAITRWPIDKEAVTLLLDAVDVNNPVDVEIDKHGEHKTYTLLEAVVASGVYTPEELCAKYDAKQLVKAGRNVLVGHIQFGCMSHKGVELLMYMKTDFNKLIKTDMLGKVVNSLCSLGGWFTNVKSELDEIPALVKSIVKTTMAATTYIGMDIGDVLGKYPYNNQAANMIKEVASALGSTPVPAVNSSGKCIQYSIREALWLRARYGTDYCGRITIDRNPTIDHAKVVVPRGVDESEYRAMIIGQVSTFGVGSVVAEGYWGSVSIQAAVNAYLVDDTQKEDTI